MSLVRLQGDKCAKPTKVPLGKLNYKWIDASSSSDSESYTCSMAAKHLQGVYEEPQRLIKRIWNQLIHLKQLGERRKALKVLETKLKKPQVGWLSVSPISLLVYLRRSSRVLALPDDCNQ
jgi:hypothetical protein